ncbi:MAG: cobalamin B12-binding domain-containing protein [Thermoleophilia bacterium]
MVDTPDKNRISAREPEAVLRRLSGALAVHDREAAVSIIMGAADAGMALQTLYADVIEPFLVSVGRSWQDGSTAVWREHVATAAVRTAVEALYPRIIAHKAGVPPVPVGVVFACPADETHDLGLRLLSDRFDLRGFRTVFVGASTPPGQIVEAAGATDARVVCLSVSTHFHRTALRETVALIESELADVRVLVGGAAFRSSSPEWSRYLVGDLSELLDELAGGGDSRGVPGAPGEAHPGTVGEINEDA